jgi:hypothetical protein
VTRSLRPLLALRERPLAGGHRRGPRRTQPWVRATTSNGLASWIGYADLGAAGFDGFEPAFDPTPLPNLVASAHVGDAIAGPGTWRALHVEVVNAGPAPASAFSTAVSWDDAQPKSDMADNLATVRFTEKEGVTSGL